MREKRKTPLSSWEEAGDWYDKIVGAHGHYYHENVIIPRLLSLFNFSSPKGSPVSLLDLACGQGVLGRHLPSFVEYCGIDASTHLIQAALKYGKKNLHFLLDDVTQPLDLPSNHYTHGTIVLAIQNIENTGAVLKNFQKHLKSGGHLTLVLNHPCFRIPRQSGWSIDAAKKMQSRRIDRYMSSLKIPIAVHPSQKEDSSQTWTYHYPLSHYFKELKTAGFLVESLEEWCSDRESVGKAAVMENRARKEFPLFLAITAIKS